MPQISKHRLDKTVAKHLFSLFWRSLSRLGSPQETAEFFSDILTSTEELMLAKRYTTAVLLTKGYSPIHIRQTLNISFTTIATVSAWLKHLNPATKKIIARHLRDESWGKFFDQLESILDSIHPMYYTRHNWKEIGKAKFKNSLARSSRNSLR